MSWGFARLSLSLLLIGLLAACATRSVGPEVSPAGDVGYKVVPPQTEGARRLDRGQSASGGAPFAGSIVLPSYPERWLSERLAPLVIEALVVIDEAGKPERVDLDDSELRLVCADCATDFAASVRAALMQWTFAPLQIADWVDGPDDDGDGEPDTVARGIVAAKPYSLRFQFTFSVRDGAGVVTQMPRTD